MYKSAYNRVTHLADQIREQAASTDKTTTSRQFTEVKGLMGGVRRRNALLDEVTAPEKTQEEVLADYISMFDEHGLPEGFLETVDTGYEMAPAPEPGSRRPRGRDYPDSLVGLVDRTEGGGEYDTLFNFANREGGAFQGVDVSRMTIGDLIDFSSSSGQYGAWTQQQLGKLATPMGRYQYVGTTLAERAEKMGLSPDTVFTPEVQDQIFKHHVSELLSGRDSMAGKRAVLRNTWEGFQHVSDADLDRAIVNFSQQLM